MIRCAVLAAALASAPVAADAQPPKLPPSPPDPCKLLTAADARVITGRGMRGTSSGGTTYRSPTDLVSGRSCAYETDGELRLELSRYAGSEFEGFKRAYQTAAAPLANVSAEAFLPDMSERMLMPRIEIWARTGSNTLKVMVSDEFSSEQSAALSQRMLMGGPMPPDAAQVVKKLRAIAAQALEIALSRLK